jgi:uncharacterized protein
MNIETLRKMVKYAYQHTIRNDKAHNFDHAIRIYSLARNIQKIEGGDLEIIAPSALFHDLIVYPKGSHLGSKSGDHSAELAEVLLQTIDGYNLDQIEHYNTPINPNNISE